MKTQKRSLNRNGNFGNQNTLSKVSIEALAAGIEVESPQLRASKLARGLVTESPQPPKKKTRGEITVRWR